MDKRDRVKIDYLCNHLLQKLDMSRLWPKLLENSVYNRDDVNIPNWQKNLPSPETVYDICSTIKTRGPHAFKNFILSLKQSGHQYLVEELQNHGASHSRHSSNNNHEHNETSCQVSINSNHPAINEEPVNLNFDDDSKDDYYTKLVTDNKPLTIKVKKAVQFKDGPEFKDIERYIMRSSPRGLVLIITNTEFKTKDSRPSAKHDEANLKQLFEEMGFKVIPYSNLTGQEIKEKVKEFSKMKELRRVDSAFIIISSHGDGEHGKQETEIEGVDYDLPNYESVFCTDIIDYFTAEQCPGLCGKPKIFIFQACSNKNNKIIQRCSKRAQNSFNNISTFSSKSTRGEKHQKAVSRTEIDAIASDSSVISKPYDLSSRNYEDTLIAYATLPGYVCYRDSLNGSWFIQILCEVFMNYACDRHLQDLFVMTDRRLKDLRTANKECQTLWIISQGFHKHCYLNPGLFKSSNSAK